MKIKEIILKTNKLDDLIDFYCKIFGLPLFQISNQSVTILAGSSRITFQEELNMESPYYHFAFNISENKHNQALKWLKKRGIQINFIDGHEQYFSRSWNSHSIYFYDPAGNVVEFIARHNLICHLEGDFSPADILNISEIGLVVDNVFDMEDRIGDFLDAPIFIEGNAMFAPLGNEEGLIILSSRNRNWLGSNKECKVFPLEVKIMMDHEDQFEIAGILYKIISEISEITE